MKCNKPPIRIRRKRPSNIFKFLIIISNGFENNSFEVPSIKKVNKNGKSDGDGIGTEVGKEILCLLYDIHE